jgi:Icc-related predicted phosphoesterase
MEKIINVMKFPIDPEDKDTILICAGDCGVYAHYPSTYKPFFKLMSERFKKVIVVPGNHSWYSSSVWGKEAQFWDDKKLPDNVFYLDNNSVVIEDVLFIGSALWTDFFREDPFAMQKASRAMSDFELIKKADYAVMGAYGQVIATNRVLPFDTVIRHRESLAYIKSKLADFSGMKTVVVTHHAPSSLCVREQYKGATLNAAYYSNLEDLILDNTQIKYWAYGHMHQTKIDTLGETKLISNAFGYYYKEENRDFDPNLTFDI